MPLLLPAERHKQFGVAHPEGKIRDLRIGPGVAINREWRDWRVSHYSVGPSLSINGENLQVAGKSLLRLPLNQWMRFDLTADLGRNNSGVWHLTVTLPGQPPKTFQNLKTAGNAFEQLTWLGFSSNATTATVFYLDNVEITNQS